MSGTLDVSVVVPAFDAPRACADAVESVLASTGLAVEILVIDDGSAQPCLAVLRAHFGERVRPLHEAACAPGVIRYHAQDNVGAYRTRLRAVPHCRGEFLKFLDQDDFLLPGVLAEELRLARTTGADVVQSNWQIRHYDAAGREQRERRQRLRAPVYEDPIDDFLVHGGACTAAVLYRAAFAREHLRPVAGFVPVKADDWLIFAQACLAGARYATLDRDAYAWTRRDGQLSQRESARMAREHLEILSWVAHRLAETGRLDARRRALLAHYLAKQIVFAHRDGDETFLRTLERIRELDPGYRLRHGNWLLRGSAALLGLERGVRTYERVRRLVRRV